MNKKYVKPEMDAYDVHMTNIICTSPEEETEGAKFDTYKQGSFIWDQEK